MVVSKWSVNKIQLTLFELLYKIKIGLVCPKEVVVSGIGEVDMTGFMTLKEASEKWGISARRINALCVDERIPGAQKLGNMWIIPSDAEKPKDERIKSGRYIKAEKSEAR